MKTTPHASPFPVPAWLGLLSAVVLAVALVAGCGGGVGEGGTGGTGGYASGPITGFGSVIVNGVRFDDTNASVVDGEGVARSRDSLRLGMTVEIAGTDIGSTTGVAASIRYDSELLGLVDSVVDPASGGFRLLGQRVLVDSATVFDEAVGGLAAVRLGQTLEVYAVFDPAAASYRATRVSPATGTATPHVRGLVAQADTSARTLRIGDVSYSYSSASGVPADMGAGQYVRLNLSSSLPSSGRYGVLAFGTAVPTLPDSDKGSLKGLISSFVSARSFSVNGRPVDASAATFSNGTAGLAVGVRVEVEGAVRSGTLKATKVSIDSDVQQNNQTFELHGAITAVNTAQRTFALRGITVSTSRSDLVYSNGTAASVLVGRQVTVRGKLSSDGLRIDATSIAFE
jgi:hypothetical protein